MTSVKTKKRDANKTFFLYVFFYHLWEGFFGLFSEKD